MGAGYRIEALYAVGATAILCWGLWTWERKRQASIPLVVRMGETIHTEVSPPYAPAPNFSETVKRFQSRAPKRDNLRKKLTSRLSINSLKAQGDRIIATWRRGEDE